MSKCFNMQYDGLTYTLSKNDVKFYNNYGIVLALVCVEENQYMQAVGVVDKDFKEVIPLNLAQILPELEIVPNGTFLYQYYDDSTSQYFIWHSDANRSAVNLEANRFFDVGEGVYDMSFSDGDALYDALSFRFITPKYALIGPFIYSKVYNQKVARAVQHIRDEEGNIIDEVDTILSVRGLPLKPFTSLKTGEMFDTQDLDEVVSILSGKGR